MTQGLKLDSGLKKMKESDFLILLAKGYEGSIKELDCRIKSLTDLFKALQDELFQIAETRKQLFVYQCDHQLKRYSDGSMSPEEQKELEAEFKKVSDALFNVPFSDHLDEVAKRFRENMGRLRLYLDKMDVLSKIESSEGDGEDHCLLKPLKKILDSYSSIAKAQNNTIKNLYAPFISESAGNPMAKFKVSSQAELDKMWANINSKKKSLEISQKLLVIYNIIPRKMKGPIQN